MAALILSAARQQGLDAKPARLRAALMLGAQPLPQEDPLTKGAGLVNAPGAWQRLQALQGVEAFGGFYDLEVDQGTFTDKGRGLLLRERLTEPRRRVTVRVRPVWAESVPPAQRFAFESDRLVDPALCGARDCVRRPDACRGDGDGPEPHAGAGGRAHV